MLETLQKADPTDKVKMDSTGSQSAGNDAIWLAGFFDGEGSIMLQMRVHNRNGRYCVPVVSACNTHKATIERISSILKSLGVGHHIRARYGRKETEKTQYEVTAAGMKRVKLFLDSLAVLLFTKREQAQIVLEFIRNRMSQERFSPYSASDWELYARLRNLNRTGSSETLREAARQNIISDTVCAR